MRKPLLGFLAAFLSWPASASPQTTGRSFSVRRATACTRARARQTVAGGGPRDGLAEDESARASRAGRGSGRLILFHRVANGKIVEALDAATGAPQWRYDYPTAYRDDFGFDEGPRAVPVVAGGMVYTFGAEGQLNAVDLATGKRIWSEDTMKRFGVTKGFFGAAGSPLVEDGRSSPTSAATEGAASSRSTRRPARCCGRPPSDEASYSSGDRRNSRRTQDCRVSHPHESRGTRSRHRKSRQFQKRGERSGRVGERGDARRRSGI